MIEKSFLHLKDIPASTPHLFNGLSFYQTLEEAGRIGKNTGWLPHIVRENDGDQSSYLINFEKNHSYGEYIFDWSWAQAYERYSRPYYPKLTSMAPFTPVIVPHFLMPYWCEKKALNLMSEHEVAYNESPCSSSHFLFIPERERIIFEHKGYLLRHSIQFHFENENYDSFEHYLSKLKSRKAKNIRKERVFKNLKFERFTGDQLLQQHADQMYQFYLNTIEKKQAIPYLNNNFFRLAFKKLKEHILYIRTKDHHGNIIAGGLFLYDTQTLYGRYWGSFTDVPNLHFELCYYQGIEFCIEKKLRTFEAGAQGEHKISRGFVPKTIYSAHKVKDKMFQYAIQDFIQQEKEYLKHASSKLQELSPFK